MATAVHERVVKCDSLLRGTVCIAYPPSSRHELTHSDERIRSDAVCVWADSSKGLKICHAAVTLGP